MLSTINCNQLIAKNVSKLLPIVDHCLASNRSLAKAIPRGQDPEKVAEMPVFQYVSDRPSNKKRNLVYLWGYSGGGALGHLELIERINYKYERRRSPIEFKKNPMKLRFVDIKTNVKDVAAGYGFTVLAANCGDSSHQLFGCGINTDSQLGYQKAPTPKSEPLMAVFQPVPIKLPLSDKDKVVRVECGRSHTICLTQSGEIYSLGNNSFGQCGRPIIEDEIYFPSQRIHQIKNIEEKVVDVICGQDHTLFLTEDGCVYACGWGADGQTGLGHYNNQGIPAKVKGDIEGERIVQISSAADCVLAINESGDVFGWGNSEYSQFESITDEKQLNIPKRLAFKNISGKIVNVSAGGSLCSLVNGNVYVWGYGILGLGPKVDHLTSPSMIPMPLFGANQCNNEVKVTRVEAGLNHLAAITNKGDLFMWGKNTKGCLGLGHRADQFFPFKVCIPVSVKKVSLGIDHTVVMGPPII